jgi:hypothetical protein
MYSEHSCEGLWSGCGLRVRYSKQKRALYDDIQYRFMDARCISLRKKRIGCVHTLLLTRIRR